MKNHEELFCHANLLQNFGSDWHTGVHGIRNDGHQCLGAVLGNRVGNVLDDASIHVEQIIASHTRLAGHTSGDDNDIGTYNKNEVTY